MKAAVVAVSIAATLRTALGFVAAPRLHARVPASLLGSLPRNGPRVRRSSRVLPVERAGVLLLCAVLPVLRHCLPHIATFHEDAVGSCISVRRMMQAASVLPGELCLVYKTLVYKTPQLLVRFFLCL